MTINLFLESNFYKADNDFLSFPVYLEKNTCSVPEDSAHLVILIGFSCLESFEKKKKNAEMNIFCSVNHWHVLLRSGVHPLLAPVPQIYIARYASRRSLLAGRRFNIS